MKINFNDLFYVCSMIEYVARITKNKRGIIARTLGNSGIAKELHDAEVNHCLSFEQVADEWIEHYHISEGDFETIKNCRYSVPDYCDIGKLYAYITEDISDGTDIAETLTKLFCSFLSDEISDFNTDLYYQNISYLEACYNAGTILN